MEVRPRQLLALSSRHAHGFLHASLRAISTYEMSGNSHVVHVVSKSADRSSTASVVARPKSSGMRTQPDDTEQVLIFNAPHVAERIHQMFAVCDCFDVFPAGALMTMDDIVKLLARGKARCLCLLTNWFTKHSWQKCQSR